MTFQKETDPEGYLLNRHVCVARNGRTIEIGIAPMLFGCRIRAGYVGDMFYYVDWCCGSNETLIAFTQGLVTGLLLKGYKLEQLPGHSRIKPWDKDPEFQERVKKFIELNPDGSKS